jgi:sensor c-di-GMP phosphodiesterase-like protein
MTAAIAVLLVGCLALWTVAGQQMHRLLDEQKSSIVRHIASEIRHRDLVFESFAGRDPKGCGPELLRELRTILFDLYGIHDILVFADSGPEAACSAVYGALTDPIVLRPQDSSPTDRPERRVWIEPDVKDYGDKRFIFIFREGNVAVVGYPSWMDDVTGYYGWELVAGGHGSGPLRSTMGQEGLHRIYESRHLNPLTRALVTRSCELEKGVLCVYVSATAREMISSEWPLLTTGIGVNSTLAFLVFLQVRRLLRRRYSVAGRMRHAIKSGGKGIRCAYQPIIDLRLDRLCGCEVLARFEDEQGSLSPADFIPAVEEENLTWAFTEIILSRALEDLAPLHKSHPNLRVSVNFFPGDLQDIHAERLRASKPLRSAASRSVRLCVEILETAIHATENMQQVQDFLDKCGFEVAIDDFGTGYSNIAQVRRDRIDLLKIDRSFIQDLDRETVAKRSSLVGPMIEIARSIDVDVVAEGIETDAQLSALKDLDVRFGQGFLLARPLGIEEFRRFAERDLSLARETVVRMRNT